MSGSKQTENRRSATKASLWGRVYRARMRAGLEVCRRCGCVEDRHRRLTFDHIVPLGRGGSPRITNVTILCESCNQRKREMPWVLASLADEEQHAPPERRWSELAYADLAQRRYDCSVCGGRQLGTIHRRLVAHLDVRADEACAGSRERLPDETVAAVLEHSLAVEAARRGTAETNWATVPQPRCALDERRRMTAVWKSESEGFGEEDGRVLAERLRLATEDLAWSARAERPVDRDSLDQPLVPSGGLPGNDVDLGV